MEDKVEFNAKIRFGFQRSLFPMKRGWEWSPILPHIQGSSPHSPLLIPIFHHYLVSWLEEGGGCAPETAEGEPRGGGGGRRMEVSTPCQLEEKADPSLNMAESKLWLEKKPSHSGKELAL